MMDNIFIILFLYIFVLFIIIKFLYNIIGPKLYFPFRLAEIYSYLISNFLIIFFLIYNVHLVINFLIINTLLFYIIYHLLNMIQTSPRTKILMDLQLLKKIKKEEYLKLYNTEIIMKNRLHRFQTSKQIIVNNGQIEYVKNNTKFINLLFIIFKVIKKI